MLTRFSIFFMSNCTFRTNAFVIAKAPKYNFGKLRKTTVTFEEYKFIMLIAVVLSRLECILCIDCLEIKPAWTVMKMKKECRRSRRLPTGEMDDARKCEPNVQAGRPKQADTSLLIKKHSHLVFLSLSLLSSRFEPSERKVFVLLIPISIFPMDVTHILTHIKMVPNLNGKRLPLKNRCSFEALNIKDHAAAC